MNGVVVKKFAFIVIFLLNFVILQPIFSHPSGCNKSLRRAGISTQKATRLFAQEVRNHGEISNLLAVFQTSHLPGTNGELRKLPNYLLSLEEALKGDFSQGSLESYLETVSPRALQLTREIVTRENLQLFFFRHQAPEEVESENRGVFINAFGEKRDETDLQGVKGIERGAILEYSGAVLMGDASHYRRVANLRSQANRLPKHAFLWFKNVPQQVQFEFIYRKMWRNQGYTEIQRLLEYFGDQLYEVDLEAVANRSLYRSGDLFFSSQRNPYYTAMEEVQEPYRSMFQHMQFGEGLTDEAVFRRAGINPRTQQVQKVIEAISSPLVKARGTFDLNDLRGLFLYIFSEIHGDLQRNSRAPVLIQMPGDEVFEVTIFGKLTMDHVSHRPDLFQSLLMGDENGHPLFPNADFSVGFED
jgi:hypothetical protein